MIKTLLLHTLRNVEGKVPPVSNDEEEVSQIRKGKEVMAQVRNDEEEVSQEG
jgi:hypothetical protein